MQFHSGWLALGLTMALAACSSSPTQPSRASTPAAPAGFLQNYSLLTPAPDDPGYRHYVAPNVNFRQYRSVLIDEPQFIVNTGNSYGSVDPALLQDMSTYYRSRMAMELGKQGYRVVLLPGPGVMRVRTAVVGVVEVRSEFKPGDLLPIKAVFDLAKMAIDKSPQVLRMSVESEALDSLSGQLLGEMVDSRESKKTVAGSSARPSQEQIHDLIDFWVARLVTRLSHANGR